MTVSADVAFPSSPRGTLNSRVGADVQEKAEEVGRRMVQIANAKMASQFNLGRPASRRRSPGSRRAATALDYRVEGAPSPDGIDVTTLFRVLGGEEVRLRILGMNNGVQAHNIWASGNAGGGGRFLAFPGRTAAGGADIVRKDSVYWKPTKGATNFLEDARDEAVAEL